MELKTRPDGNEVYVDTIIVSPSLGEKKYPISFLVDTGASTTTISALDAKTYDFNFKKFKRTKNPSYGIGGKQTCEFEIYDVTIQFQTTIKRPKWIYAEIHKVDVIRPPKRGKISFIPSLLGTDLLHHLKFTYSNKPKLETR